MMSIGQTYSKADACAQCKPRATRSSIFKAFASASLPDMLRIMEQVESLINASGITVPDINALYPYSVLVAGSEPLEAVCKPRAFNKATGELFWYMVVLTQDEYSALEALPDEARNDWLVARVNMDETSADVFRTRY